MSPPPIPLGEEGENRLPVAWLICSVMCFQTLMQRAGAGEVGAQEFHLVGQHVSALQIDIFGVGRCEGDSEQLHARLLGGESGLVVIAAQTCGDNIIPVIRATLTQGAYMIARELSAWEHGTAVEADVAVTLKQGVVVQWWGVLGLGLGQSKVVTIGGNDGVHRDYAAAAGAGVDPSVQVKQDVATAIGNLIKEMQSHRAPVVDPPQRHAGNIGAQDLLL